MANKLLNYSQQALDNNETDRALLIYKGIVDLYPKTGFATTSKNQIKKIVIKYFKSRDDIFINFKFISIILVQGKF